MGRRTQNPSLGEIYMKPIPRSRRDFGWNTNQQPLENVGISSDKDNKKAPQFKKIGALSSLTQIPFRA